jgi:hypothetical protein
MQYFIMLKFCKICPFNPYYLGNESSCPFIWRSYTKFVENEVLKLIWATLRKNSGPPSAQRR